MRQGLKVCQLREHINERTALPRWAGTASIYLRTNGKCIAGNEQVQLGKQPRQRMVCQCTVTMWWGPGRAQTSTASRLCERSPELVFVTVLQWPRVSQMSGKNTKLSVDGWICLTVCLLTAHGSEVPTAVCIDMGGSPDSPIIKFLSQVTLLPSTQAVSKAGNGSRNQSEGSEAGDCLLPRSSSEAAFRSWSFLGKLSSAPAVLTWTWNQHLFCW